jgi:pilus assembly protein CpaC
MGAMVTTNGGPGGYGGGDFGVGGGWGGNNIWSSFIINELRVPGEYQINLRVRIAELSRSQLDRAGVDINVLFNDARNAITTTMGGAVGTLSGVFENGEIGIFLDYLCTNGTAKVLTEPQMTVLSGRNARLLSGGEFAVPTIVGVGGAAGTTTSFRGFGTSLLATPTVVDRDLIRISVIAEYSNLNPSANSGGILGTDSRRIQTEVELREGQTLALAGLLSHGTKTEVSRIPLLGDIPKIGPLLFSSKTMTQEENELLVLITPEIVRPMDAHEVPPVPGFEVTKPSHMEFWKYNMTEGAPDVGYYHLPPYGSGSVGTNVDYQHFNPGPAGSMYSPVPTSPMSNARGITPGAGGPPGMGAPGMGAPGMGAPGMSSPMMSSPGMSSPVMSSPGMGGPGMGGPGMGGPGMGGPGMGGPNMGSPGMVTPTPSLSPTPGQLPSPSSGRLYPVPQSSMNGQRPNSQRYSNQVMIPGNNSGIRQAGFEQPNSAQPAYGIQPYNNQSNSNQPYGNQPYSNQRRY